jgi:hypothetical protein
MSGCCTMRSRRQVGAAPAGLLQQDSGLGFLCCVWWGGEGGGGCGQGEGWGWPGAAACDTAAS